MKKDIHPEYMPAKVHCACGNERFHFVYRIRRGAELIAAMDQRHVRTVVGKV